MSFFEDGSRYGYLPEAVDGSINIGWLDASTPFPAGEVPPAFVDRLVERCRHPVNLTRGWHFCNLCPRPQGPGMPTPTEVTSPDGDYPVGHGEIRVTGGDGVRYAAPDMIAHYVTKHGYRPPEEFVAAVLGTEAGS